MLTRVSHLPVLVLVCGLLCGATAQAQTSLAELQQLLQAKTAFDNTDFAALQRDAIIVPGFEPGRTRLAAVSRAGATSGVAPQLALCWGPRDVVAAFSTLAGHADGGTVAAPGAPSAKE